MLADAVLVLHVLVVAFNVGGLVAAVAGGILGWSWTRRGWRRLHLALVAFVTAEAILGITCPLTSLEDALRGTGGEAGFIGRWLFRLLYWDFPSWVFALAYLAFLVAVVAAWLRWPPAKP